MRFRGAPTSFILRRRVARGKHAPRHVRGDPLGFCPTLAFARRQPRARARPLAVASARPPLASATGDATTTTTSSTADRVTLGTSDLSISAVGVGAWAWGDRSGYWGSDWKSQTDKNLDAYRALLRGGVVCVGSPRCTAFQRPRNSFATLPARCAAD